MLRRLDSSPPQAAGFTHARTVKHTVRTRVSARFRRSLWSFWPLMSLRVSSRAVPDACHVVTNRTERVGEPGCIPEQTTLPPQRPFGRKRPPTGHEQPEPPTLRDRYTWHNGGLEFRQEVW